MAASDPKKMVSDAFASGQRQASAWHEPINYRRKRRKKARYTRGTKGLQLQARRVIKDSERVAQAVADGLDEFNKRSKKSRRRRRDGALVDSFKNAARGLKVGAKKVPARRLWKYSRPAAAFFAAPLSGFLR